MATATDDVADSVLGLVSQLQNLQLELNQHVLDEDRGKDLDRAIQDDSGSSDRPLYPDYVQADARLRLPTPSTASMIAANDRANVLSALFGQFLSEQNMTLDKDEEKFYKALCLLHAAKRGYKTDSNGFDVFKEEVPPSPPPTTMETPPCPLSPPPASYRLHAGHTPGFISPSHTGSGGVTPTQRSYTTTAPLGDFLSASHKPLAYHAHNYHSEDPPLTGQLALPPEPQNSKMESQLLSKLHEISRDPEAAVPVVVAAPNPHLDAPTPVLEMADAVPERVEESEEKREWRPWAREQVVEGVHLRPSHERSMNFGAPFGYF